MSSGEVTCCYCQATFSAPPGKSGRSFQCPQCRKWLARAAQKRAPGGNRRSVVIGLGLAAVAVAEAVVVLGYAGIRIFGTASDEIEKPRQPAQAAPGGAGSGTISSSSRPSVARSRIAAYHQQNGPGARAIVALGMPFAAQEKSPVVSARAGILQRELIRQAFLIAARDELGLLTRDDVLGERQNAQTAASSGHEIQTISGPNGLISVVVREAGKADAAPIFERDLTGIAGGTAKTAGGEAIPEDLANLALKTEELSRRELPEVLRKLGLDGKPNATKAEGQVPEAIKVWRDDWAYEKLAEIYAKKHDISRWLQVLERFLEEGEGPALNQAQVRVVIATYYMSQKQWEKARPYAEAAAATGAAWAMVCAQNCAEGRKDWKQAEKWARATSERYGSEAWDRWYTLCRKSGTGDIEAAFAFASEWASTSAREAAREPLERAAGFYLSSFQLKKALPILERVYGASPSASGCALPWLVADLLDDQAARDRYFERLETQHETESPQTVAIWRLLHKAIERDGGRSLDVPAIANERQRIHPGEVWLFDFIIGMFLQKHGRPLEAREFLQRAAENRSISESIAPVARDAIRKLDEDANRSKASARSGGS